MVTVSSGASPSGRVHLGNLREFLTVHFVAEELPGRGLPARHLHVWDDFDRFRKVPVGVDASWSEHIGRPLSKVPDPEGCHDSWAEHFKEPLRDALHAMGVEMEEISQTERYEAGHYRDQVLHAVAARDADRGGAGPPPHQGHGQRARDEQEIPREHRARRTSRSAAATSRASPTSPTAATAAATPSRSRRTTTRRTSSPTPATSTATPARPPC